MGICHICGNYGHVTFEHVPPESAFNNKRVIKGTLDEILEHEKKSNDPFAEITRGEVSQRGVGAYTLCGYCNNDTGRWYGDAYAEWAYQGFYLGGFTKIAPSLAYPFHIFPLRIIKQIVCMFFSTNGPQFQSVYEELVKFVLNKHIRYIQPNIRIYAGYNLSNKIKQSGLTTKASLQPSVNPIIFSEIAFPPWIYIMTLNSSPPDKRLIDITFFSRYGYNEWKDVVLQVPILPMNTWLPGDFRNKDEVIIDYLKNVEYERNHPKVF